jgi:hypothetical protein
MRPEEEIARENHRNGYNCAMSVYAGFAEKLGLSEDEARQIAPKPRAEGGKCGAYLAGRKILEQLKPEAAEEFDKRFVEIYGHTECSKLIMMHGLKKNCNNYVGDAARLVEELLQ